MWTVIFTCHCWLSVVSWPCFMAIRSVSSVKSLFRKSVCTCCFLFRWLVNDRSEQGTINHTSWAVDVALIHHISLLSCLCCSYTCILIHMHTHITDIHAQMGFHIWLPGAVGLALKTPITSVKYYDWLYWSFSAIMQYVHEQWLNMNCMGGKRGDKLSVIRSCEALGYIHTLSY